MSYVPFRNITLALESQMEKKMEGKANERKTS